MTSIVQKNCQIIGQLNRENLGTRLGYFGSEYKMAEQSFHSFHEEEIRELLTKNQGSKLTHANSENANDFDNLRVTKQTFASYNHPCLPNIWRKPFQPKKECTDDM